MVVEIPTTINTDSNVSIPTTSWGRPQFPLCSTFMDFSNSETNTGALYLEALGDTHQPKDMFDHPPPTTTLMQLHLAGEA